MADSEVLRELVSRLHALQPQSPRRWGTLTPHEMLCHLGDATAMVLGTRPRDKPAVARQRRMVKALALWTPIRWPHGWKTNPMHDPKARGTTPSEFARDLQRAVGGLQGVAAAAEGSLEPVHGFFGSMSLADWHRWAWKHTDHHLRQFGL